MYPRTVICALGLIVLVSTVPSPSPSTTAAAQRPCLFENAFGARDHDPCAPFTIVRAHPLAIFSTSAFGGGFGSARRPVVALSDGSAMVANDEGGLFRIDQHNRVLTLWQPNGSSDWYNDPIELLSSFRGGAVLYDRKAVMGVRRDGSIAFRKQVDPAEVGDNITAVQDPYGVVWIAYANGPKAVYAFVSHAHRVEELPSEIAQGTIVTSQDGSVYDSTNDGLFELKALPHFQRHFVHGPVPLPTPPRHFGIDGYPAFLDIQVIGSDGSLWGTTFTQVIHVHPDGSIHVIRLAPPLTAIRIPPHNLELTIARDGAVWLASSLVRITNDDRVQKIDLPRHDGWRRGPSFGPDNSAWTILSGESGGAASVAHFSIVPSREQPVVVTEKAQSLRRIAPENRGIAARATPDPARQAAPRKGPIQFLYVANSASSNISAYWIKADG